MEENNRVFEFLIGAVIGLGIAIPGIAIPGALGYMAYSEYNSEQHRRIRELESECFYITPDPGKEIGYKLEDGRVATVKYLGGLFRKDCLEISLDNVSFRSKGISPEDAWVLETLFIRNSGKSERFNRDNMQDYDSWATEYQKLIDEIAERRAKFEGNTLAKIRYP